MATQENQDRLFPTNQQTIVDAHTETEEERKRREEIEARHEEVMDAVRNVQQGKSMLNTGNNGDTSYVQNNTFTDKDSASKPDIYMYPDITAPQKTAEEAQGWWNSYWAKQLEQEKEREIKRIDRQRFAKSLGDLGGVIGDIIKAHNGAVVLPRDVQKQYDSLSAQQKQIIDNYWAKMDGLRREQEAKDAAAAQAEREAEKEAARLKQAKEIEEIKEEGRNNRAAEDIGFRRWKTEQDNVAKLKIAQEKAIAKVNKKQTNKNTIITFSGVEYTIPKNAYYDRITRLYSYLNQNKLFPKESNADDDLNDIVTMLYGYKDKSNAPENSKAKVENAVLIALPTITDDKHVQEVIKILGGTASTPASSNGGTNNSSGGNQSPTYNNNKITITRGNVR